MAARVNFLPAVQAVYPGSRPRSPEILQPREEEVGRMIESP
jgi:hypothetical protein